MSTQPTLQLLQERDFGQKINATFEFVTKNFKPLMLALLYIAGPPALIAGIFMGQYMGFLTSYQQSVLSGGDNSILVEQALEMIVPISLLFVSLILAGLATMLVTTAYMLEYEAGNRNITPDVIWNRIKNYIVPAIGYSIVAFVLIVLGTILFIIPGVYVSVAWSFMIIVMMRENLGVSGTFQRCLSLIGGKWWSTFGLLVVMGIVAGIIGYAFQIPSLMVMIPSMLGAGSSPSSDWLTIIIGIISTVGSVLTRALVIVATNFQYYNLVERKEGTGLQKAIDQLGNIDGNKIDRKEDEF